jgi:hypothetical protein
VAASLDAFNYRDPDALAAVFDAEATNDIVGDWEEARRKNKLRGASGIGSSVNLDDRAG